MAIKPNMLLPKKGNPKMRSLQLILLLTVSVVVAVNFASFKKRSKCSDGLELTPALPQDVPNCNCEVHQTDLPLIHRKKKSHPASDIQFRISIIAYRRLPSLKRLLQSLIQADYMSDEIALDIYIEADENPESIDFLQQFHWPFGLKTLHYRVFKGGLISAVSESWFPSHSNEYVILLEDDLEVSPLFYRWVRWAQNLVAEDESVVGISLYTPRVAELVSNGLELDAPVPSFNSSSITEKFTGRPFIPYKQQLPCSWGSVYFPRFWKEFHSYMAFRMSSSQENSIFNVPASKSVSWQSSWKKFAIELCWAKGYSLLYPNFPDQTSFSTNHLEPGEHIQENDTRHRPEDYTVPLMMRGSSNNNMMDSILSAGVPKSQNLPLLNIFGQPYTKIGHLAMALNHFANYKFEVAPKGCAPDVYRRYCEQFNLEANEREDYMNKHKLTVLVSHYFNASRMKIFMKQLEHYAGSAVVDKVLVVWHDPNVPTPQPLLLGSVRVEFLSQSCNSLNNRFKPDLRIVTEAVLTVDDDIMIHHEDLEALFHLWKNNTQKLVGFFPRYHEGTGSDLEYVQKDTEGKFWGYTFMLTKAMIMHKHYLYEYTCGAGWGAHPVVDEHMNAEDIAMNLMVIKLNNSASPLFLYPNHKIGDHSGDSGLHQKKNHQDQRTVCLQALTEKLDVASDNILRQYIIYRYHKVDGNATNPYEFQEERYTGLVEREYTTICEEHETPSEECQL